MGDNDARDAEIQARFNLVKQRYGDRLTADELDEVRKDVADIVDSAKALSSAHLDNSDEPFSLFVPYRKET